MQSQAGAKEASGQMSRSEQDAILALVAKEQGKPDRTGKRPPIVARYLVVPGPIVAKYLVVPPWANSNAHQAIVNKAVKDCVKDGYLNAREATRLAKLFNRDIAEAEMEGRNIRPQVAAFLNEALEHFDKSSKSAAIIFGEGGPGHVPPLDEDR